MLISLGSILLLLAYLLFVELTFKGWTKLPVLDETDRTGDSEDSTRAMSANALASKQITVDLRPSVVVCCRNEEYRLPELINALSTQNYANFELILVDDHSDDGTWTYMQSLTQQFPGLKTMQSIAQGKKLSQREGAALAAGDFLIFTDADCVPNQNWIASMVNHWQHEETALLLGPVQFNSDGSLFQELQKLEMASLVTSAAGTAGSGIPILANASNMSCSIELWKASASHMRDDKPSGDDMFLLMFAKKIKAPIRFVKSRSALVSTSPNLTVREFIDQRLRWGSKSTALTDFQVVAVTFLIFLVCLWQVFGFLAGFIQNNLWMYFVLLTGGKWMADYFLMNKTRKFFGLRNLFLNSILLSIVYPLYIVGIAIFSMKLNPVNWRIQK